MLGNNVRSSGCKRKVAHAAKRRARSARTRKVNKKTSQSNSTSSKSKTHTTCHPPHRDDFTHGEKKGASGHLVHQPSSQTRARAKQKTRIYESKQHENRRPGEQNSNNRRRTTGRLAKNAVGEKGTERVCGCAKRCVCGRGRRQTAQQ